MLKKLVMGLLLTSSLFCQDFILNFFKYSTAYASFSLNAPRYQDDKFAIVGGLSTGDLVVERADRAFQAGADGVIASPLESKRIRGQNERKPRKN